MEMKGRLFVSYESYLAGLAQTKEHQYQKKVCHQFILNHISVVYLVFFLSNLATKNGFCRYFWLQNSYAKREPCLVLLKYMTCIVRRNFKLKPEYH